ncbi:MAG: hypothetical protein IJP17_00620 [Clostridia bacterium]|nr:hypothetical protein [Clostridia bacterium]
MRKLTQRITALLLAVIMIVSLCSCGKEEEPKLMANDILAMYEEYSANYDRVYSSASDAFPDMLTQELYDEGRAGIDGVLSGTDLESLDDNTLRKYLVELVKQYNNSLIALIMPVMQDILADYGKIYASLGDAEVVASMTDALSTELAGMAELAQTKHFINSLDEKFFDELGYTTSYLYANKFRADAFLLAENPQTMIIFGNFDFPLIREQNNAFALEFYSSQKALGFSHPDTLYNSDAISYLSHNIVAIDLGKVITEGNIEDIFGAYKRITLTVFGIDNSYTFEADLSGLRSDDLLTLPFEKIEKLNEVMDW